MECRLQKCGNSNAIRIPNALLKSLDINTNDIVNIYEEDNKIIISKKTKSYKSLKERINEYEKSSLDKQNVEPYDWGEDVGVEKCNATEFQ